MKRRKKTLPFVIWKPKNKADRPRFFKPFSLEEEKFPVFPETGFPRNAESNGLLDWFIRRELEEGSGTWRKKKVSYPPFVTTSGWPLAAREHIATHAETRIGLHKILSWIESGGDEYLVRSEVEALWNLLESALRRLNRIALTRPELLRPFAEYAHAWPILYSDHKTFRNNNAKVIEAIHLSKLNSFNCDKAARTDLDDELTKAAGRLVWYLNKASRDLSLMSNCKPGGEPAYVFDTSTIPAWYMATAHLKEFTKDTCPDWWKLGKQAFLESYPNPQNENRFGYVKDTTPGRRRSKILWLMQDRMEKLAKVGISSSAI